MKRSSGIAVLFLCAACGANATDIDASVPDGGDAGDGGDGSTYHWDAGGCGGTDGGCGCGLPPPAYDAGETLSADLALFDGSAPDGGCPALAFGVPWGDAGIAGATLFRGCTNTTLYVTSSCGDPGQIGDWMVFDSQGKIIGATQMSGGGSCISTGPAPDYVPCGADASAYPYECEVLCGCDAWKCRPFDDAGVVTDGSPE